jgi:archaellum component FlaC
MARGRPPPKPISRFFAPLQRGSQRPGQKNTNNLQNEINTLNDRIRETTANLNKYVALYGTTNNDLIAVRDSLQTKSNELTAEIEKYNGLYTKHVILDSSYGIAINQTIPILKQTLTTSDIQVGALNQQVNVINDNLAATEWKSKMKTKELYDNVIGQNNKLYREYEERKVSFSSDDQKVYYQGQQVDSLKVKNGYFMIFYFLLWFALIYVLFGMANETSQPVKTAILIVFLLYPFLISFVEIKLFELLRYLWSMLNGNVYMKDY